MELKGKCECKNCKYFSAMTKTASGSDYLYTYHYCDPLRSMKYGFWGVEEYDMKNLIECKVCNEKNDCSYYERRPLHFWVKKDPKASLRKQLRDYMHDKEDFERIHCQNLKDPIVLDLVEKIGTIRWAEEIKEIRHDMERDEEDRKWREEEKRKAEENEAKNKEEREKWSKQKIQKIAEDLMKI